MPTALDDKAAVVGAALDAAFPRNLQGALESRSAIRDDKRTQIGSINAEIKFQRLAIPRFQVGREKVVRLQACAVDAPGECQALEVNVCIIARQGDAHRLDNIVLQANGLDLSLDPADQILEEGCLRVLLQILREIETKMGVGEFGSGKG